LVDDEADIRLLMRALIDAADEGLYVEAEAATGEAALERLEVFGPDVVVLDQMMPGLTGIEVARVIRERWPELPIVLCSAYLSDELVRQAEEVGVTRAIGKGQIVDLPRAAGGRFPRPLTSTGPTLHPAARIDTTIGMSMTTTSRREAPMLSTGSPLRPRTA
jgi:CheY-like chemotaxis protein